MIQILLLMQKLLRCFRVATLVAHLSDCLVPATVTSFVGILLRRVLFDALVDANLMMLRVMIAVVICCVRLLHFITLRGLKCDDMVAGEAGSLEIFQLESCRVLIPHVLALAQTQHVLGQVDQFLVGGVVEVWYDGNAIVQLESE